MEAQTLGIRNFMYNSKMYYNRDLKNSSILAVSNATGPLSNADLTD